MKLTGAPVKDDCSPAALHRSLSISGRQDNVSFSYSGSQAEQDKHVTVARLTAKSNRLSEQIAQTQPNITRTLSRTEAAASKNMATCAREKMSIAGQPEMAPQQERRGEACIATHAFSNCGDIYNPVRPPGIGEVKPGGALDENRRAADLLGERCSWSGTSCDGSRVFRYAGKLRDQPIGMVRRDTTFTGKEVVSADGTLMEVHAQYDRPIDITFKDKRAEARKIARVASVRVQRDPDGSYYVSVLTSAGAVTFHVSADGAVV